MDNSVHNNAVDVHHNRTYSSYSYSSSSRTLSHRDIRYSCGACGYDLNLSSSNRNTSSIDSKYGKSIKRGMLSFFDIDESRFTQADEIECVPHFSKHSWGLFRRKTKLLCRKCCNHVGYAYNGFTSSSVTLVSNGAEPPSLATEAPTTTHAKYDIRIRALQPSSSQENGISVLA